MIKLRTNFELEHVRTKPGLRSWQPNHRTVRRSSKSEKNRPTFSLSHSFAASSAEEPVANAAVPPRLALPITIFIWNVENEFFGGTLRNVFLKKHDQYLQRPPQKKRFRTTAANDWSPSAPASSRRRAACRRASSELLWTCRETWPVFGCIDCLPLNDCQRLLRCGVERRRSVQTLLTSKNAAHKYLLLFAEIFTNSCRNCGKLFQAIADIPDGNNSR